MGSRYQHIRKKCVQAAAVALWFTAILIITILIFSCALPQDLARTSSGYSHLVQIAFFGRVLSFHMAILLACITAIALPLRRWRLCILAGVAALIAFCPSPLNLLPRHASVIIGSHLRLMSMNLKYTHADPELIVNQVCKFDPDVLVLQDYTPFAESALKRAFGTDYPYRCLQPHTMQGLAMYSRRPFVGGDPQITFNKTRRQLRAVVDLDGIPVVIYVEHPYSPRTRQRIINNRLATVDLARQVTAEKDPVIVAGDFNFTDRTPNQKALDDAGLCDAFDLAGHGRGSTWPVNPRWLQWLPGFRIDHIFISHQLSCTQFALGEYDGSDHLPIMADVRIYRTR